MQRPDPRESKGAATRRRILTALEEAIEELGYERVTIAEVTRRADVTRPAFYFHFESLGAAFSSLMERLFDQFTGVATGWYEHGSADESAAFRAGMAATVDLWRAHSQVMDAVVRAAAADPAARRVLDGWIDAYVERALPVVRADATMLGDATDRITRLLVETTFDAMGRDVRAIVGGSPPDRDLADSLSLIWTRSIYLR
ncbi:TetR/AcrR family transcriptional regulator [Nocardioides stalactiti]|uniref:TetR/AcrR family transcriptional regulator n=1 Tax=Nocardioides stalactiti TaxID=2755356 RepID=UPI001600476E|nr:TetR/AcrR family transcriptional regulator [Nocardioides stalactiti]